MTGIIKGLIQEMLIIHFQWQAQTELDRRLIRGMTMGTQRHYPLDKFQRCLVLDKEQNGAKGTGCAATATIIIMHLVHSATGANLRKNLQFILARCSLLVHFATAVIQVLEIP